MKAIVVEAFGEPDVLKIKERPTPHVGSGQVLVRIMAAGVNPVETYIRTGTYTTVPKLPYTPGSDGAGVVEHVADDVTEFKKGDRVYLSGSITGTYAELALCQRADIHFLPSGLGFAEGAGIGIPYGTAYRALVQRGHARSGETVLIHGASGGVGTAAIQLAHLLGLRVLGTAGSEHGLAHVTAQGAQAFNHHTPEYLDRIREAAGATGVTLILEMLANVNLAKDMDLIANHGRIVIVGTRGEIKINPRLALTRESDIRGMSLPKATPMEKAAIYAGLEAGLESGILRPTIAREFPLADAAAAHEMVMKPGSKGKLVLIP